MYHAPNASTLEVVGRWKKSQFSTGGNCVELGELADGQVAMRNSKAPNGPALIYSRAEIAAFIDGARAGDFALFT